MRVGSDGTLSKPVLLDDLGQPQRQLAKALVARGADLEDLESTGFQLGTHHFGQLTGFRHVDLAQRDDPRPVGQPASAVRVELGFQRVEVADRIAARVQRGAVEHVDQHAAALDVAQEFQAETLAFAGPGNESGHVSDGVGGVVAGVHDSEIGYERGEGIVGDLGPRRRDGRDQR